MTRFRNIEAGRAEIYTQAEIRQAEYYQVYHDQQEKRTLVNQRAAVNTESVLS